MFAYIVKRLLLGVVVVVLVSMIVFLLFFVRPVEPGPADLRPRHRQPVHAGAAGRLRASNLGYNNPWYEEYGKCVKGIFVGRDDPDRRPPIYECPAPCLGYLLPRPRSRSARS